jgi:hypothetical protein
VAGRLRWGDPPLADLRTGQLPQPPGHPAARRHLRHPLGERLAATPLLITLPAALHPGQRHQVQAPAHVFRMGRDQLMHPGRGRPAARARRRGRVIGDRPHLQRTVRAGPRIGDLQPLHAKQHRRRILDHDARGFLLIMNPGKAQDRRTAGFLITAARQRRARSPSPGKTPGMTHVPQPTARDAK